MFAGKTAAPTGKAALASEVARNAVFVEQCRKEECVERTLAPLLHRCYCYYVLLLHWPHLLLARAVLRLPRLRPRPSATAAPTPAPATTTTTTNN